MDQAEDAQEEEMFTFGSFLFHKIQKNKKDRKNKKNKKNKRKN